MDTHACLHLTFNQNERLGNLGGFVFFCLFFFLGEDHKASQVFIHNTEHYVEI